MLLKSENYHELLQQELERRQKINPMYSQRAFARQLGVSPGELSEVLRGRRKLSLKSALKIAKSLGLNQTETKHLIHLTQLEKSREFGQETLLSSPEPMKESEKEQMTMDLFHLVSDWYCFAILNLADCSDFKWDYGWIAKRLGILTSQARTAVERLERVGLIKFQNGKRILIRDFILSPSGISSEAIRNYHRSILRKVTEALDFQSVSEREISGIGLAVDPKDIESIRKDIQEFQEQIASKYAKGKKRTEVYQLEVAFVRLTEGGHNEV